MSKDDKHRVSGISIGALVARMAGSIALAIGAAATFIEFAPDLGPRSSFAIRAAAGIAISAAAMLLIVRWINRRPRRRVSTPAANPDALPK
jgi:hypothetical protein